MQFRHLRYFVAIVEAGSFSRAAGVVHIVQPALSQQIAELEEEVGLPLLLRGPRGVRPTAAGEVLYREALAILQRIERLPAVVRSSSGADPEGTVSLGMSSSLASFLAGPFMQACMTALPRIALQLVTDDSGQLFERLKAHKLDLALLFEGDPLPGLVRTPLMRQRLYFVRRGAAPGAPAASQPVGAAALPPPSSSITLAALAAQRLVLAGSANVVRVALDRAFAAEGLAPTIVAEANVLSSILPAVQSGFGGTVVPKGDFADLPGCADLVALPIEPAVTLDASLLASAEAAPTRAGEAVRDLLRDFVRRRLEEEPLAGAEWIGG